MTALSADLRPDDDSVISSSDEHEDASSLLADMFEEFAASAVAQGSVITPTPEPSGVQLDVPGPWGIFKFSKKAPQVGGHGAYEVTCPFHILSRDKKSLCKKLVSIQNSTEEAKREALRKARVWACQARDFVYQFQHVHHASLDYNWSFSELEARRIDDMPSGVLDDQQHFNQASQESKEIILAQRGRGRGGRGGVARGKIAPKAKGGPRAKAPTQHVVMPSASSTDPAPDPDPAPAASSNSSDSTSTSDSSSSADS